MKAVAEIVAAIILLVSGSYIAPSLIKEFKAETINKLHQGLQPLMGFTNQLNHPNYNLPK